MPLHIISADERRANATKRGSVLVTGLQGSGKTSLLFTLDPASTLFLDFEAGSKSVQTWGGDSIEIRTFPDAADIACLIGGPDPALPDNEFLSRAHHKAMLEQYKGFEIEKYNTIFFDSISELSFAAWQYSRQSPRAFTNRGEFDGRGAYGALAENMLSMLRHLQHSQKNVIFVCKLMKTDKGEWDLMIEGAKTGNELPFIVDQIVTLSWFDFANGAWTHNPVNGQHRAFCCEANNPFGLPGKQRTMGNIQLIEEPHLGKLLAKINAPAAAEAAKSLSTAIT